MKTARKTALLGLLTGVSICLSFLESLLPPLPFLPPGAKAGFSNIITMFTAITWGLAPALTVALLKSVFVLLTRGVTAFCMSVAGGLLSTLVMWLCFKCKGSLILTGILGSLAHNTAQFGVAVWLTGTPGLVYYLPFLLVVALITGTVTGLLLKDCYKPLYRLGKEILKEKN